MSIRICIVHITQHNSTGQSDSTEINVPFNTQWVFPCNQQHRYEQPNLQWRRN